MIIRLCSVPLLCLAVLFSVGCGKSSSKDGKGDTPTVKDGLPEDKKLKKLDPSTGGGTQKETTKGPSAPGPKPD